MLEELLLDTIVKCPIPIKLNRVKTDTRQISFLDVDAINALKNYLNYREFKTEEKMQKNEPIFINHFDKPITEEWVRHSFRKLVKNIESGGIMKKTVKMTNQFDILRILLKSTLIACDTDRDVADVAIGHKVRHQSQKNSELDVEKMCIEYAKASKTINVFEKLEKILNNIDN